MAADDLALHAEAAEVLEQQLESNNPNLPPEIRRSLARLGAGLSINKAAESRAAQTALEPVADSPKLQLALPFGDDTRVSSNDVARSALFAAVKERAHFKTFVQVKASGETKVEFKGDQLNQDDQDTLMQLVIMGNHKPLGEWVCQSVNAVLKGLGRHTQEEQRRQLFAQIERLVSTTVKITMAGKPPISGHFISTTITPEDQKAILPQYRRHLAYKLNSDFAAIYQEAAYTFFNVQERRLLKGRGSELAKWLHLWIIGNAEQYPHKVETIRQLCGSTTKELKNFRVMLRQALDLLKSAGIISAWNIDPRPASEPGGDLVTIERERSISQQKHITKKSRSAGQGKGTPQNRRYPKPR